MLNYTMIHANLLSDQKISYNCQAASDRFTTTQQRLSKQNTEDIFLHFFNDNTSKKLQLDMTCTFIDQKIWIGLLLFVKGIWGHEWSCLPFVVIPKLMRFNQLAAFVTFILQRQIGSSKYIFVCIHICTVILPLYIEYFVYTYMYVLWPELSNGMCKFNIWT